MNSLKTIAIYERPTEHSKIFIAVEFISTKEGIISRKTIADTDSLDEIRNVIPASMQRISRAKEDDPYLIETWI